MPQISCNSINIYYETYGEGSSLLFIHGLGSSTADWKAQIDYFTPNYKVIALDLRGHGQSDKPLENYSITLFADDVACLIKKLNIQPTNIVGISLGGMIAMQLAVNKPELLKSLIVVNSPSEFLQNTFKARFQIFLRFFIVKVMGMHRMGKVLAGKLFPKPEHEKIRNDMAERWAQNNPKTYWQSTKALLNWTIIEHLDKINCPALIIGAEFDYFPVSDKELLASRIKNAKLKIIKDSHHGTPLDQTEIFNKTVEDFLSELS